MVTPESGTIDFRQHPQIGVRLDAQENISVGNDVVGRDKNVTVNINVNVDAEKLAERIIALLVAHLSQANNPSTSPDSDKQDDDESGGLISLYGYLNRGTGMNVKPINNSALLKALFELVGEQLQDIISLQDIWGSFIDNPMSVQSQTELRRELKICFESDKRFLLQAIGLAEQIDESVQVYIHQSNSFLEA